MGFKFCIFIGFENNKKFDFVLCNNFFFFFIMLVLSCKCLKCWMLFFSGIFICFIVVLFWKYIDIMKKNFFMVVLKSERVKRIVNKYLSWIFIGYLRINVVVILVLLKKFNWKVFLVVIFG